MDALILLRSQSAALQVELGSRAHAALVYEAVVGSPYGRWGLS